MIIAIICKLMSLTLVSSYGDSCQLYENTMCNRAKTGDNGCISKQCFFVKYITPTSNNNRHYPTAATHISDHSRTVDMFKILKPGTH